MVQTEVTIGPLRLKNPVLTASGTFGYGDECLHLTDVSRIGGLITKSLSLKPRAGNPPPRITETPSGMLNSIGLANIGVHEFIAGRLPRLRTLGTAIVANIAAGSIEEYSEVLSILEEQTGIDGYEINVSCPNVKEGGLSFGTNCELTARITRTLRPLTKKALIIKLTPNVTRIADFAKAVADEGADAVSAINTLVGMSIDVRTRKPRIATVTGGLSGPAIRPVALAKVYEIRQAVRIPIIGIGGIATGNDAIEFLLAGATAVQVGTANFINPASAADVAEGIRTYCEANTIPDVRQLIGGMVTGPVEPVLKSWL